MPLSKRQAVIVAMDLEPLGQERLTSGGLRYAPLVEIGFSVLDLRTIGADEAPGDRGEQWYPKIQSHHFVVEEYGSHYSKKAITGPSEFLLACSSLIWFCMG